MKHRWLVLALPIAVASPARALPPLSTPIDVVSVTQSTGEKPQSKVGKYAGRWWCVLPNASGTQVWRLDGHAWTAVLQISAATDTKADVKAVGAVTHVLLYRGTASQLVSIEYVASGPTYQLWASRPTATAVTLPTGVEVATLEVDSRGRMWVVAAGVTNVEVRWSDSPYTSLSAPITLETTVNDDDIATVVAFPNGSIGVLWSNQTTKRFGFRKHTDGAAPDSWSALELAAAQSANDAIG